MRSLSWKLAGALLLMVVVSVGLMAYITNRSTAREFEQYISRSSMMYTQTMADTISQFYSETKGWADIQGQLNNLIIPGNSRLIVADSTGLIIGDTSREWLGRTVQETRLVDGTPIIVSEKVIGELYGFSAGMMGRGRMGGMMGSAPSVSMLDVAEQNFLSRVNNSLWIAGLISAAVALLLGLALTRQLTRPIRALTTGARQIAKGDFGYRVKVHSKDELGQMAQSFNSMATSLDDSERARHRLTADIAHELRTPLTVIEGTAQGILDGVFKLDKEHLKTIKEQTTLLTRLIGDLRDLSLIESGQLKLNLTLTDIVELVRRKLSQAELKAKEKNVKLELKATQNVPQVKVDSDRMEQVIANLIANAVRHSSARGNVAVSINMVDNDRQHQIVNPGVVIAVTDTGEGIAPEHLPHVFERFYRAEDSRARSEGGTGLGLSIVRQMIKAHGGQAWAESEPGKGSSFYVSLPLSWNVV